MLLSSRGGGGEEKHLALVPAYHNIISCQKVSWLVGWFVRSFVVGWVFVSAAAAATALIGSRVGQMVTLTIDSSNTSPPHPKATDLSLHKNTRLTLITEMDFLQKTLFYEYQLLLFCYSTSCARTTSKLMNNRIINRSLTDTEFLWLDKVDRLCFTGNRK